jgi:hypothetical protein
MDVFVQKVETVEIVDKQAEGGFIALSELQLAFIGGGIGDVVGA